MQTASEPLFRHVAIIGVGLLGASLGLALRERRLAAWVTGVGRPGSPSVAIALARGAIDGSASDIAAAMSAGKGPFGATPDLVVLCTPVREFPVALQAIAPHISPDLIVTDVGSTKREVMAWARTYLPAEACFVGSHPMAGSEKRGPEAARASLYEAATCLMCVPHFPQANIAGERVRKMWEALGMRVLMLDAEEHDRWVAAVSHLPHAVAFTLVNAIAQAPEMFAAAAGGFLDATRTASSDPRMWTDIFMTNRAATTAAIDRLFTELHAFRAAIAEGNEAAIRATIERAKATRDALPDPRMGAALPEALT